MKELQNELELLCRVIAGEENVYIRSFEGVHQKVFSLLGTVEDESRRTRVVFARQLAMSICATLADHKVLMGSLSDIGEAMGDRDHSTVLHSRKAITIHIHSFHWQEEIGECAEYFGLTVEDLIYKPGP